MAAHLTLAERQFLHRMVKAKKSKAEIGALMNRHRSTIYRELARNSNPWGYRAEAAHRWAHKRREGCRRAGGGGQAGRGLASVVRREGGRVDAAAGEAGDGNACGAADNIEAEGILSKDPEARLHRDRDVDPTGTVKGQVDVTENRAIRIHAVELRVWNRDIESRTVSKCWHREQ